MADIHLGFRQYGSQERMLDFATAFMKAMKFAVEQKADFVIISGDLFHKKSEMDPVTLTQATKVLEMAKKNDVPVIAVEGNHDATFFRDGFSWMDYLSRNRLIINLKPRFDDGVIVEEWNGEAGAFIDLEIDRGVRIYGMKYYGNVTEKILEEYVRKIKNKDFTIFTAHVGVEGYVNMYGCISATKLHRLKNRVDYVALGHIHRSFVEGDFIFNPGSLESCDATEYGYERGIFLVDVDDDGGVNCRLVKDFYRPRPFVFLNYRMKEPDTAAFEQFLRSRLEEGKIAEKAVIHVNVELAGIRRGHIDEVGMEEAVKRILNPLVVRMRFEGGDRVFQPVGLDSRESIERHVISQILQSYSYGEIADHVLRLKSLLLSGRSVADIDSFISEILDFESDDILNGDVSEADEAGKPEPRESEPQRAEQAEEGEPEKSEVILEDEGEESKESEEDEEGKEGEEDEEDEEEWDWRRAYASGSKAGKR